MEPIQQMFSQRVQVHLQVPHRLPAIAEKRYGLIGVDPCDFRTSNNRRLGLVS